MLYAATLNTVSTYKIVNFDLPQTYYESLSRMNTQTYYESLSRMNTQTYYESLSRMNTLPHDGVLFHNIFAYQTKQFVERSK